MTERAERPTAAHRILLVESEAERRQELAGLLGRAHAVTPVESPSQALELLRGEARYAVVLCGESPEDEGQLLVELRSEAPSAACLLMAEPTRMPELERSPQRRAIDRMLPRSCALEELDAAVEAAIELHEGREAELTATGELEFVAEALRGLTAHLEERFELHHATLRRLHRLSVELNGAANLAEVARIAAEAVYGALGGPGVHVQIWDPREVCVDWNVGPEMSDRMLRVPLATRDGVVGELVVDALTPGGDPLDPIACDVLDSIACSTAVAVHNELRRRERDEAQYATIVALARLSEQRDNETGRHLERVSLYAKLVAEGLRAEGHHVEQITDGFVRDLVRSAPLHDIGKVGIPDAILLKPGKLSASEWEIMKTHAEIGAATLKSVMLGGRSQGFLEMGHDIALCHHEKWDGSGYPRGLAGEAIPLSARIVALADVYDALTTVRPYKQAWPHEKAVAWIRDGAGSHFDPNAVAVFVARAREVDSIRTRLADEPGEEERADLDVLARAV